MRLGKKEAGALLTTLALIACGESQTMPSAPASQETISASDLAAGEKTAILAALSRATHEELTRALGAHRLTLAVKTEAEAEEGSSLALSEEAHFAASSQGDWELLRENSKGWGFSLYQVGGATYLANRYAPLRPAELSKVKALREETFRLLATNFSLCAHLLQFTPKGQEELFGRDGLLFTVSPAPIPDPAPSKDALSPEKAWRATIQLKEAEGELLLDKETYLPLRASLSLRFQAEEEGVPVNFSLTLTQQISEVRSEEIAIALPEAVPLAPAYRLSVEREALLGEAALRPEAQRAAEPEKSQKATKSQPARTQPVQDQTPPQSSPKR